MGRLKVWRGLLVLALLAATPQPVTAQALARWEAPIAEASARFGIPAPWIRRVIDAESAGQTSRNGRPIRSRVGAMGLMQLMPGTWRAMRHAQGLGADPDDPRDNILAGTAYLRAMYDRFGHPGLFAAYNAGPARYAEHLSRGRGLPAETVAYVAKVTGRGSGLLPQVQVAAAPSAGRGAILALGSSDMAGRAGPSELRTANRPEIFFRLATSAGPEVAKTRTTDP